MRGYMKATAALAAFALLVVVMGLGAQNSVQAQVVTVKVAPLDVCSGVVILAHKDGAKDIARAIGGGGGCAPGDATFTITNSGLTTAEVEIKNTGLGVRPGGDYTRKDDDDYTFSEVGNPKTIKIPKGKKATVTVVRAVTGLVDVEVKNNDSTYEIGGYNGNQITVKYSPDTGTFGTTKTVTVDNIKPALLATRPANNLIVTENVPITFSAEITDSGSGFSAAKDQKTNHYKNGGIQLWVAGNQVSLAESNFTAIDDGWRVSYTRNSSDIAGIGAAVPWYFSVKDKAGNPQTNSDSIKGVVSTGGVKVVTDDTFVGSGLNAIAFTGIAGDGCITAGAPNSAYQACVLTGARQIKVTSTVEKVTETSKAVDIESFPKGMGEFGVAEAFRTKKDADGNPKDVAIPPKATYEILGASLIRVDGKPPTYTSARTGHAWNSTTNAPLTNLSAKANSIKVVFSDGNGSGLDPATVTPSAFAVSGNSVESVLAVDSNGPTLPAAQQTPDTVYLTLGSALGSSEKPTVSIGSGLIKDKAGNALTGGNIIRIASDGLGPNLTLSRSAALSRTSVTVTVTSDEQLADPPVFTIQRVDDNGDSAVGGTVSASSSSVTALSYKTTVAAGSGLGEYNVYVEASDTAQNEGDTGKKGDSALTGSFSFELDNKFNYDDEADIPGVAAPVVTVSDKTATSGTPGKEQEVEAVDPMIVTIDYRHEASEYSRDSYGTVELLSASLKVIATDNTSTTRTINIATEVSSPDNKKFTLPVLNPQVGTYELKVKGQDQAGNSDTKTLKWKVISAKPVKIKLVPGWNLISLPFQPGNPAINSVVPANHPADIVMTYDNAAQVWLVSRRDSETGLFTGDIAVMTANTAYFIRTDTYKDLSVLRPPVATAAAPPPPPPAVSVVVGWNLVPVISLQVPTPPDIPADTYFGTLQQGSNAGWLKALTFDPLTRTWTSVTPGDDTAVVEVGKGYWLYATNAGVIIP